MDKKILENIRIINKTGKLEVVTELIEYSRDETIIELLYTLTGTEIDETFLRTMSEQPSSVLQTGYASIGILKSPGKTFKQFSRDELFLLPPYHQKYLKIEKNNKIDDKFLFLRKVSVYEDKVKLLFLPILCAGLFVCEFSADYEPSQIVFVGENLLSFIVSNILNDKYMLKPARCFKTISEIENDSDNWIITVAEEQNNQVFFLFESSAELIDKLDSLNIEYFDLTKRRKLNWFTKAREEEAMQLLPEMYGLFEQIVSAHVHAEDIENIMKGIDSKRYQGKTIVFDW